MQVWFIFSLIFSLIVATFAVLNSEVVTVNFFWVNYELSQSAIILISAVFGAAIAVFLGLFRKIKSGLKMRELSNELKGAEKKIELLNDSIKTYEQQARANASGNAAVNSSGNTVVDEKKPADPVQS